MTWRAGGRPRRHTLRMWRGGTRTWRAVARAGGRAGYAGEVSLRGDVVRTWLLLRAGQAARAPQRGGRERGGD